jgi:hypothetical protein
LAHLAMSDLSPRRTKADIISGQNYLSRTNLRRPR